MEKDEIFKNINGIQVKLNEIFDYVISEKELSKSKGELLKSKLTILINSLNINIEEIEKINDVDSRYKSEKFLLVLGLIISLIIILAVNPIIGLLSNLVCAFFAYKLEKKMYEDVFDVKEIVTLNEKIYNMNIVFENCIRFIDFKCVKDIKDCDDDREVVLNNIELACDEIKNFIETGKINNLNENIKEIMIYMLQDDLNTEENNLEKLLNMAKEIEKLEKGKSLSRKKK